MSDSGTVAEAVGAAAGAGPTTAAGALPRSWFGHPRGLATLFFTEIWERFSFYGMRGLLILFMTAAAATGGLGLSEGKASAVYGLYTAMVYFLSLPGGWVADKLWGPRRSVFVGGASIALGHFSLAMPALGLPEVPFFVAGLVLIVVGTGLLKPNVSAMVGDLYPEGGARRDAGFSVFYMGVNLGAFLGPLVCGYLGENVDWHLGFSAAGVGMVLGLVQYRLGDKHLGQIGRPPRDEAPEVLARRGRRFCLAAVAVATAVAFVAWLGGSGIWPLTLTGVVTALGFAIVLFAVLFFAHLVLGWRSALALAALAVVVFAAAWAMGSSEPGGWAVAVPLLAFLALSLAYVGGNFGSPSLERRRLLVIFWLFLLSAAFWCGFEQAGSSMNLFAESLTDRLFHLPGWMASAADAVAGLFGAGPVGLPLDGGRAWEMPASWLQSVNPIFIILLAPVFGWLWTWLARRRANPPIPVKFGLGLLGLAAGFAVLAWGALHATDGRTVSPNWLVVTYFLHTCGELCLSPVGLSSVTKLAPRNRVSQMMGIWFVSLALGNLVAGLVAGKLESLSAAHLFRLVALGVGGVGFVALLSAPFFRRVVGEVE